MRTELLGTIQTLADKAYQQQAWVEKRFPPPIKYDCFDYAVNFLFDDSTIADDPKGTIGLILNDEHEAAALEQVINAINIVLDRLGTKATDEEYINSPEWDAVIRMASEALQILKRNED